MKGFVLRLHATDLKQPSVKNCYFGMNMTRKLSVVVTKHLMQTVVNIA